MMNALLIAVEDHAAHAPHADVVPGSGAQAIMPALTALIVFTLLLLVLWRTVWPRITQGLDDRNRKILQEIEAAEQAQRQAKAALAEYERSLATAREEAGRMIAQARSDAKAQAAELTARNQQEMAAAKDRAMREIDSAKQAALSELHAQATGLATSIAGRILRREITVKDQQQLVEESLRELAGSGRR